MTFIIKFLPLLKGLAVIHVYSQKKLSRMTENQEQQLTKGYKEIDLLFGCDIKTNSNLDFRYSEPKKLQQIEKFLIEFLISIRSIDIFRDPNLNRELKYFNYDIIKAINSVPSDNGNSTIESLLNKINAKLHEIYSLIKTGKTLEKTISINSKIFADIEKLDNLLFIQKEDILKDLFENNPLMSSLNTQENGKKTKQSRNIVTGMKDGSNIMNDSLDLSKIEEPLNGNVTINQSEDMSVIGYNPITTKQNLILKQDTFNLNKLVDMSSIAQHTFYSNRGNDELIKPKKVSNKMINDIEANQNTPQLNIKVPNPKENNPSPKRQQKLILLDEKENNIPSTLRELLPTKTNQKNI